MAPFDPCERLPEALVSMQLRGIGRQALQVEAQRQGPGPPGACGGGELARSQCSRNAPTSAALVVWSWLQPRGFPWLTAASLIPWASAIWR
jgi:hypothetical protein